eukprot:TRINITY_DN2936_c0_g1_i1.p1 TRINITY_DN2936_c0_g1~~TRINITY_DN2936_c0_g1_i1.p1  ORF type:complete len:435 (+),score=77.50 TRINITY_DN2936_c0_g1_i1:123-1427(+)
MSAPMVIKNTFLEVRPQRSETFQEMSKRRQTDPGGFGGGIAAVMDGVLDPTPMPKPIPAAVPIVAPAVTVTANPTVTFAPGSARSPQQSPQASPSLAPEARRPSVVMRLPSEMMQAVPSTGGAYRRRLSTSGESSVRAGRRCSFDIPQTPDAYFSRSRAGSVNFGMGAVPPITELPPPMLQPGAIPAQAYGAPWMPGMPYGGAPVHNPYMFPQQPVYGHTMPAGYPMVPPVMDRKDLELGKLLPGGGVVMSPHLTAPLGAPVAQMAPPVAAPVVQQVVRPATVSAGAVAGLKPGEEPFTTVMLRNIPVKYNREMMLADMDARGFVGAYDFFYLPIDFQTGNTVGYAFVNFVTPTEAARFRATYNGLQLSPDSTKICEVSLAKAQGKAKNVEQYRNSSVMSMEERFKPLVFENGIRVAFPPPTRSLKPVKPRVKQ